MRNIVCFFIIILLNANYAFAEIFTENTPGACSFDDSAFNMRAVFIPQEYSCSNGYYLPANAINCASCPPGNTCSGGTYPFNANMPQGINAVFPLNNTIFNGCTSDLLRSDQSARLVAVFEPASITCPSGQYLPANADACSPCPVNNYCVGGTYTFNETSAAGAVACPSGTFSPRGWSYCTHMLNIGDKHIYLRTTPQTVPSLNIDIDNDGIADYFANMTTLEVPMSAEYANELSNNHLVIDIAEDYIVNENVIFPAGLYYVYDDTVVPE